MSGPSSLKVAAAVLAALIPTTQVGADPVHAPPQPLKREPAAGVAVRVTWVPAANEPVHVPGHAMVPGLLETAPEPAPFFWTANEYEVLRTNVADAVLAASIVTVQVAPAPAHAPPQALSVYPG